jgi:hypothetical protein
MVVDSCRVALAAFKPPVVFEHDLRWMTEGKPTQEARIVTEGQDRRGAAA